MRALLFLAAALPLIAQEGLRDFISQFTIVGTVVIEGGIPAQGASIRGCGSGEADSKGRFTAPGRIGSERHCFITIEMRRCEPRSVAVSAPAGLVDVGTIVLKPIIGKTGAGMASFTSLAAPSEVRKLRERARKNLQKNKPAEAERDLERAVAVFENDAEAWFELGFARRQTNEEKAREAFEKSCALDTRFAPPLVQLAVLAMRRQNWSATADYARKAIEINPADYPDAWLYLATAKLKTNDPAGAEQASRQAIANSTAKPLVKAHHILGVALAQQGRTAEAIEELRAYLKGAGDTPDAAMIRDHIRMLEQK